jgi:hypothetical protein
MMTAAVEIATRESVRRINRLRMETMKVEVEVAVPVLAVVVPAEAGNQVAAARRALTATRRRPKSTDQRSNGLIMFQKMIALVLLCPKGVQRSKGREGENSKPCTMHAPINKTEKLGVLKKDIET